MRILNLYKYQHNFKKLINDLLNGGEENAKISR